MKMLIVTYHYPPEISGGVARPTFLEKEMIHRGHEVTILAPQKRERGIHGAHYICVRPWADTLSSRPIMRWLQKTKRAFLYPNRYIMPLQRALLFPDPMIFWAHEAARVAINHDKGASWDVVFTTSPPESVHMVGERLSAEQGTKWYADFRDGWTFEPHRSEALWPFRRKRECAMEKRILQKADIATFATRPLTEYAVHRYSSPNKFFTFPTGYSGKPATSQHKRKGEFRMVYGGRILMSDPRRRMTSFAEALTTALERHSTTIRKFRLDFYGTYSKRDLQIIHTLTDRGIASIHDPVPANEMISIMKSADALLLITPPDVVSITTRKLFDYLATQRPIFALAKGNEAERIINETKAGICAPPGDTPRIIAALEQLFTAWENNSLPQLFPGDREGLYHASNTVAAFLQSAAKVDNE